MHYPRGVQRDRSRLPAASRVESSQPTLMRLHRKRERDCDGAVCWAEALGLALFPFRCWSNQSMVRRIASI